MGRFRLIAFLQITRPANILTAIADIWAGIAIAGGAQLLFFGDLSSLDNPIYHAFLWLTLSTVGLYGGGVAFNDVFDAKLDAVERPERPIPSGRLSVNMAAWLATALLLLGVFAAWQVNPLSFLIAFIIALLAVLYDFWGKHQFLFGPINMGLCRAGNLILGISAVPIMVLEYWYLGAIPLVYVAAITMISRGEVHGKNDGALKAGFILYGLIIFSILFLAFTGGLDGWQVLPFLVLLGYMIFPPLLSAIKTKNPKLIGKAVKAGVISLIILNSCLSSAFGGWKYGVFVLLLLPISLWLARKFAVT